MEEIFDIYTRNGEYLGVKKKSECHKNNPGFYHKPVWIWIINNNGEILIQKRAKCKKTHPNLWDMSSAGHVISGESPIEGAIRETYEELGINITGNDLIFVKEYIYDLTFELAQIYILKLNKENIKFKLKMDEVEQVKWVNINEFEKLFYSDQFVPFDDKYKIFVMNMLKNFI